METSECYQSKPLKFFLEQLVVKHLPAYLYLTVFLQIELRVISIVRKFT